VSSLAASRVEAVAISIIVVGCAVVAVVHLLIMEWFERGRIEVVSA
jgi:cytochrome b subunit of formate dehydrogenase